MLERYQDRPGARGEAGWSASHSQIAAELNVREECACTRGCWSREVLGMRSESGEWRDVRGLDCLLFEPVVASAYTDLGADILPEQLIAGTSVTAHSRQGIAR